MNLPANVITCTQCGGELHPDQGQIFLTCPFCSSTVYLDKSRVVFHWYVAPTLDENGARSALARWMAGNQTVKDLDKKSRLAGVSFQYYPVWYFKHRRGNQEVIDLQPAAATSVTELRHIKLLAGDLRKYEHALAGQSQEPNVPLETALEWLKTTAGGEVNLLESSLVHIPIYTFKYLYQNRTYTAIVEAATGSTIANIYPAKAEAPYLMAAGITGGVYLCLATFPLIGYAMGEEAGMATGLALCGGLGLLAAPFLFALAAWVAAKI